MNTLDAALAEIVEFLESRRIPYMLIGGLAASVWGKPRYTRDVDLTIWIAEDRLDSEIAALVERFTSLAPDPLQFARQNHLLAVAAGGQTRIDLIFGFLPYEKEAIDRSRPVEMIGRIVRVCAPEDLIILKVIAFRDVDELDIRAIMKRQSGRLDLALIDACIRHLADVLDLPSLIERWEQMRTEPTRGSAAPSPEKGPGPANV